MRNSTATYVPVTAEPLPLEDRRDLHERIRLQGQLVDHVARGGHLKLVTE